HRRLASPRRPRHGLRPSRPGRAGHGARGRRRPRRGRRTAAACGGRAVKIYTKTGDDGTTGLIGTRTRKDDPRVGAYGEVDELNAVIGLARVDVDDAELSALLQGIQRDLFAIGARLADPGARRRDDKTSIPDTRIAELEQAIDAAE